MKIVEKIKTKQEKRLDGDPINIVFLGDSVTQGCFEDNSLSDGRSVPVTEYSSSFASHVGKTLNFLYPNVQINIINCGASGRTCGNFCSEENVERYIRSYHPDLTVVSFGLNDVRWNYSHGLTADTFGEAVGYILSEIKKTGSEAIFITQNFMCDRVDERLMSEANRKIAEELSYIQNSGLLKDYFVSAKKVCESLSVPVIDGYYVFEKLSEAGVDTNDLLAGYLNHPVREYHRYLAVKICEKILLD
ncbi:MAG: SGNH/GDSL hydrolase family protein [Clostridia bacterium]|nr:SGNH/GDSL hydrolase family protein [Clostridia bacterium]